MHTYSVALMIAGDHLDEAEVSTKLGLQPLVFLSKGEQLSPKRRREQSVWSCDVRPSPDDPEWHIFFTIRTGVRYTGMPAWDKTLSEPDMWKITMLLSHLDKLPPAVQEYWKTNFGVEPGVEKKEGMKDHDHH